MQQIVRPDTVVVARPRAGSRGFTLAEMLLAVFILGIGVISIAALFPAGIALQRQATDDTLGPVVAQNAFSTIRSKLSQEDFGSFQDFGVDPKYISSGGGGVAGTAGTIRPVGAAVDIPQVSGDWGWMRPAFFTNNTAAAGVNRGTVDIFAANFTRQQPPFNLPERPNHVQPWAVELPEGVPQDGGLPNVPLFGMPYNRLKYPLYDIAVGDPTAVPPSLDLQALLEPNVTFTQAERSFPQGQSAGAATPAYYWDCMFRRNGGRVQVAVFVYRVTVPGGETRPYRVAGLNPAIVAGAPAGAFEATQQTPPIPSLYLAPAAIAGSIPWPLRGNPTGQFTAANGYTAVTGQPAPTDEIFNTHRGTPFSATAIWDDWQLPNAWLIDNHGSVHKVLNGRTRQGTATSTDPGQGPVRLQRRIPILPASPVNGAAPGVLGSINAHISGVWFVPQRDQFGNILTPIYAAVEEL
jgi:prepilin-type N-terminal cleavage/methylation domain-containing protein